MNTLNQYRKNDVNFIEVIHNNFKVVLCDWAASLYQIWFDNKLMTVQAKDIDVFKHKDVWFGKTIGRVAGRIVNGKLTIDDKQYQISINDHDNSLHGGVDGISNQIFTLKDIKNDNDKTIVSYQYLSKDGQSGFGGNFLLNVIYEIDALKDNINIIFKTKCDKKCPANITNHSYFSLGEPNINNLKLLIRANNYISVKPDNILPVGVKPVDECFDFTSFKLVTKHINDKELDYGTWSGYDNYFLFNGINKDEPQVQLENNSYHLDVYTDYESVVMYSDNTSSNFEHLNTPYFKQTGITVEAQHSPFSNFIIEANKQDTHFMKLCFRKK